MKTLLSTLAVFIMLAALATAVLADAKGPNAGEFGPAWCADGSTAEKIVHVGKSFTGQYPDSTRVGIAFTEYLVDDAGNVVEEWLYTPGKRPTTWCIWRIPNLPDGSPLPVGWTVQGDVLLTPEKG